MGLLVYLLLAISLSVAQTPSGTVSGIVLDPSGGVIVGADVLIINNATGVQYAGRANSEGYYMVPNLPPGTYRIQVSNSGFKTIIKPDIVIHVEDALAINFTLPIGAASEIVTVEGGAAIINTENASVGTVIDRNFVESLPLNGRSFNTLLQLTPGVVISPTNTYSSGQFSIAGQRTSANNFLVDGVSANFGVSPKSAIGISGGASQAFSALGGTSSLVSVEALQEFRLETSSFAPEFGRSPGGQVMLTTRSGTNDFHGGIYEYLRNTVFDADNWFANSAGEPRAPEHHNDFGGFFSGSIQPDKTFFFASYEGARLGQPNTQLVQVPSEYARSVASPELAPYLAAYPQPGDKTIVPGVYTAQFAGNYSNPSTLNAGSIRIDHRFNNRFSIFGRYNEAPSETATRNNSLSEVDTTNIGTRTLTVAVEMGISPTLSNSLRGNYSVQNSNLVSRLDSFGGANPPSPSILSPSPFDPSSSYIYFDTFDTSAYITGPQARNRSAQANLGDDFTLVRGTHQIKFGGDYRAIYLKLRPFQSALFYYVSNVPNFLSTGQADDGIYAETAKTSEFLFQSTSIYAQDTWTVNSRLSMTYGLRWELSPAPSGRDGTTLAAWRNVNDPAEISLAPSGSPLWYTTYTNFAPRVGVAYGLTEKKDFVLRAGWGIFSDLGSDAAGFLGFSFPNTAANFFAPATLPLPSGTPYIVPISLVPPFPSEGMAGYTPNLTLPRSYQWNVALEKSFGGQQTVSVTYVGQAGRDLLRQEGINQPNADFTGPFRLTENNAYSNYDALQVQYRKPFSPGLQALLNYTWSHSLDNASDDTIETTAISSSVISAARDYSSSSFDVRQSFSGAVSYAIPGFSKDRLLSAVTKDWSIDGVVVARTGIPFNAVVLTTVIGGAYPRPDLVTGQPVWISNPSAGGGKSLNPAAFSIPPAGQQGSEGRNDIKGFGLTQVDLSLARKFPITERISLLFRIDAFNVLNHPNFANPYGYLSFGPSYLESSTMLNQGLGGLTPLFQQGGPRSLQLSLKLSF
jgi:outer membrane receptor protein involved in Fe transport